MLFSKIGYQLLEKEKIDVTYGETVTVDATLNKLPVYSVVGKVLNINNRPVNSAKISLTGYTDYSVVTNENGVFTFPEFIKQINMR